MDRLPNVTRTKIQGGIHEGFVKVNDEQVKPNYRVHPDDVITVAFPEPPRDTEVLPENIPLNIVFEDANIDNAVKGGVHRRAPAVWTRTTPKI